MKRQTRSTYWGCAALVAAFFLRPEPAAATPCLLLCSCGVSATSIPFGSYNPLSGTSATAAGTIQVTCYLLSGVIALTDSYSVAISGGQSGSSANRAMLINSGTGTLAYNLYSDPGMTSIWGDTSGGLPISGGITVSIVGIGVSNTYTVYGRIPASQVAKVGNYSDTLIVTLTF